MLKHLTALLQPTKMAAGRYLYLDRKACRANKGAIERGEAPLLSALPLPLLREGGQGDRITM